MWSEQPGGGGVRDAVRERELSGALPRPHPSSFFMFLMETAKNRKGEKCKYS
jgi:hypothetical protein